MGEIGEVLWPFIVIAAPECQSLWQPATVREHTSNAWKERKKRPEDDFSSREIRICGTRWRRSGDWKLIFRRPTSTVREWNSNFCEGNRWKTLHVKYRRLTAVATCNGNHSSAVRNFQYCDPWLGFCRYELKSVKVSKVCAWSEKHETTTNWVSGSQRTYRKSDDFSLVAVSTFRCLAKGHCVSLCANFGFDCAKSDYCSTADCWCPLSSSSALFFRPNFGVWNKNEKSKIRRRAQETGTNTEHHPNEKPWNAASNFSFHFPCFAFRVLVWYATRDRCCCHIQKFSICEEDFALLFGRKIHIYFGESAERIKREKWIGIGCAVDAT